METNGVLGWLIVEGVVEPSHWNVEVHVVDPAPRPQVALGVVPQLAFERRIVQLEQENRHSLDLERGELEWRRKQHRSIISPRTHLQHVVCIEA